VQMMTLPFRLFGLGLQAMAQAIEGAQRPVEKNLAPWEGAVLGTSGLAATRAGAPVAMSVAGAASGETFASNAVGSVAAAEYVETKSKEDKDMSCCCDQNLCGNELKIVQYTIASVGPYLKDDDRIILGPDVIAISDDMTDCDFTAYILAKNLESNRAKFDGYDTQYLRVCYTVMCRLTIPCRDYERDQVDVDREQVEVLREINRTLKERDYNKNNKDKSLVPSTPPTK